MERLCDGSTSATRKSLFVMTLSFQVVLLAFSIPAAAQQQPVSGNLPSAPGAIAIDSRNPATLYAVLGSDIYKSTNGGGSWTKTAALGLTQSLISMVVDPSNSNTIYAGGGFYLVTSVDGGQTWKNTWTSSGPKRCGLRAGAAPRGEHAAGGAHLDG
jgi:photosystem II stability/assembly factor-like uncharacterized protein